MKKTLLIALLAVLLLSLFNACAPSAPAPSEISVKNPEGYINVDAAGAKDLIDTTPDLIIIDVASISAFALGHLPNAVNYPLAGGSLEDAIPTLDKSKPYLVYCHGSASSILGAQMLIDADFMPVYRLDGNYISWTDAGYPVMK